MSLSVMIKLKTEGTCKCEVYDNYDIRLATHNPVRPKNQLHLS